VFPRRKSLVRLSAAIVVTVGLLLSIVWFFQDTTPGAGLPAGLPAVLPGGFSQDQYLEAAIAWQAKRGREPDHEDILVNLGDTYAREGKLSLAIDCYATIPTEHPLYGLGARLEQAKALVALNRAPDAEANLRAFLDVLNQDRPVSRPQLFDALDLLRFLLGVQLRFEERQKVLLAIHTIDGGDTFETMAYCFCSVLRWNGPQAVGWLEDFLEQNPDDFWLRVALGRYRTGEGKLAEAETVLKSCCQQRPENLYAQAALLACYYELDDWVKIKQIMETLPPIKKSEPWLLSRLRGHLHNHEAQYDEAVACFQHALAVDPANGESYLGLAKAYGGLDRDDDRAEALRKAHVMARLQNRLGWAATQETAVEPLLEIIELCEEIGLVGQALLVAKLALKIDPSHAEASKLVQRLKRTKDT
jgi:tetratricopeptide (TPR) repeat protein